MEKTNFTQMMRWVKGAVLAVVAMMSIGLQQADAQTTCLDGFTVPLDDSCKATISLDMVTAGTQLSTTDYKVVVQSPGYPTGSGNADNTNGMVVGEICAGDNDYTIHGSTQEDEVVYGEGDWMYGVYEWDDEKDCWQLYCWGTFTTEDKRDPHFVGDTTGLADVTNTITDESVFRQYGTWKYIEWDEETGTLDSGDPTFQPGIWSCWQSTNHADLDYTWPTDSARAYETNTWYPDATGIITVIVKSNLNSGVGLDESNNDPAFDPVLAVYVDEFDPENPCENLIAFGESSFIPNPLAGLGFTNGLSNTSIDGADQDDSDNYAPWLLHEAPVVRMDIKVDDGQDYVFVVTHREDTIPSSGDFELYIVQNDYDNATDNDDFGDDDGYAYFEFTCPDVDAVMLTNQHNVDQDTYIGGTMEEMSAWLDFDGGSTLSDDTYANRENMNARWRTVGEILLGVQDRDTSLIDIDGAEWYSSSFGDDFNTDGIEINELLYHYGYMPMVIENCDDYTVNISDTYMSYGDCGVDQAGYGAQIGGLNVSGIITRTFVVSDAGTKTDKDTARIQLVFRNPNLYDVRLPHYTVNIECDEIDAGYASTDPSHTGYPFVSTLTGFVDLTPTNAVCNLAAGYEDVARVETCANTYKFRREWTVYDWCRPGTTIIYNQLIKVGDWEAPELDTPGDATATQNPANCQGTVSFTAPVYTDNCGTVTYTAKVYAGKLEDLSQPLPIDKEVHYDADGTGSVSGLEHGWYTVVWTATDDCGNEGILSGRYAELKDNIAPSCVIDDLRSITLTDWGAGEDYANAGEAWVTAERLDEGSWDNCGTIATIKVSRMTATGMTDLDDKVSFTCADEGQEILVELHVWDNAATPNHSVCWTYIKPVDKTKPTCDTPADKELACSDVPAGDLSDASVWDDLFAEDSDITTNELCNITLGQLETLDSIDQCGVGKAIRHWEVSRVIDGKRFADTCTQTLTFYEYHHYTITFPADETVQCTELDEVGVTFTEGGCDLITISTSDERYNASAEECYKIFRTYKVINWCEYEGTSFYPLDLTDCDGEETTLTIHYGDLLDGDDVVAKIDCGESGGSAPYGHGAYQWTQVLKVYDDAEPTVVFATDQDSFPSYSNAAGCPGDVSISATLSDGCTTNDDYINVVETRVNGEVVSGTTEDGAVATHVGNYPSGTHTLTLVVRDGCGNVRTAETEFTVYDAKGPAPVCIEGFAAELMPLEDGTAGMAVVNAVDFVINNPIADCSGAVSSFEITRVTSDIEAALAADDLAASLSLDCDDIGQIDVAVVATDAAGNADYCVTTITVQDNVTPCSGAGAEIAGLITTEENSVVSGVEISLNADKSVVTAVDGGYFFSGLALGGDYSIAPRKDEGYLNGVSTYDLVLISKHILGVTPLASPYKLIAADVNNSNSITTLDLIQLRKLILSVDTRLANNTSWRFVPAEYSFLQANNPWAAAFPEVLNINDFDGSANGDFVAIKVGDVNNSALIDVQPRRHASFALHVEDRNVKAGNEYTVSFKATAADVEGFQFALSYRGLELVDIVEGIATADNFGTKFTGEGVLLTSWNGTTAEGELFSLVFRATQDVVLSEALSVSTRHLNAEAYNTSGEAMNVAINFNSGAVAEASFELKQNTPNPFKGETVIGFNLAEASHATLTINDVTGRVLKVVRGDFAKGANQVSIDSKELPAAGVLYYTLTAGEYTATKKMIIIE
jgi:hypothetical protein